MILNSLRTYFSRLNLLSRLYYYFNPESENQKYCRKLINEKKFEDLAWFVNNYSNVITHRFYNKILEDYSDIEYHEYLNLKCILINSIVNHSNLSVNYFTLFKSLYHSIMDSSRRNLLEVKKSTHAQWNAYNLMKKIFNKFYINPMTNYHEFNRMNVKYRNFNEVNSRMILIILLYAKAYQDHELITKLANDIFFHPNYDYSMTIRIDNILDPVFLNTVYYDGYDVPSNINFRYLYNSYLEYIALSGKTELIQLIFNSISRYLNGINFINSKTPFIPSKYIKIAYEKNHLEAANQLIQETLLICSNDLSGYASQTLFMDLCTLPKPILKESLNSEALHNSISQNISSLFINKTLYYNEYALEYLFKNFSDEINQISDNNLQFIFDNIFNKHNVKALEYLLISQPKFIVNNRDKWLNIALRNYKDIKNCPTIFHVELENFIKCIEQLTQLPEVAQYLENFIKYNELTNKIEIIEEHPEIESITVLADTYIKSRKKSANSSIESHTESNTHHGNSEPSQEIKKKLKL